MWVSVSHGANAVVIIANQEHFQPQQKVTDLNTHSRWLNACKESLINFRQIWVWSAGFSISGVLCPHVRVQCTVYTSNIPFWYFASLRVSQSIIFRFFCYCFSCQEATDGKGESLWGRQLAKIEDALPQMPLNRKRNTKMKIFLQSKTVISIHGFVYFFPSFSHSAPSVFRFFLSITWYIEGREREKTTRDLFPGSKMRNVEKCYSLRTLLFNVWVFKNKYFF